MLLKFPKMFKRKVTALQSRNKGCVVSKSHLFHEDITFLEFNYDEFLNKIPPPFVNHDQIMFFEVIFNVLHCLKATIATRLTFCVSIPVFLLVLCVQANKLHPYSSMKEEVQVQATNMQFWRNCQL